jgi:Tfp pilus assembly protein PilF
MRHLIAATILIATAGTPALAQPTREHLEAMRHLRLGQENLHAERWDKAETEFKAAIKLDPLIELAHYGLGQTYMATKRFDEAVVAYKNCRDAFNQVASDAANGQLREEQRVLEQIQQLEDQKAQLQSRSYTAGSSAQANAVARIDSMIGELRARRYQSVDRGQPDTPTWISVALGSAYFRAGAMADAEREYRAAIAVDPKLGEAHNNLAVVYLLTRRFDEADAEIKAAEKSGFKVNPQMKEDLKKAAARR